MKVEKASSSFRWEGDKKGETKGICFRAMPRNRKTRYFGASRRSMHRGLAGPSGKRKSTTGWKKKLGTPLGGGEARGPGAPPVKIKVEGDKEERFSTGRGQCRNGDQCPGSLVGIKDTQTLLAQASGGKKLGGGEVKSNYLT